VSQATTQTETLRVWPDEVPDADLWRDIGPELERPPRENSRLVRNVSEPTITVFRSDASIANGTGVVVCPGGAFHFLMVDKEGTKVARWLNPRGVTVFVLKYRVVPTPDDDDAFVQIADNPRAHRDKIDAVRPMVVADGVQAMRVVRQQASRFGVDPQRLGVMGFSAGGFVAASAATEYDAESRPSFAAAIYPVWVDHSVPDDVPPLFLAHASDDDLVGVQNTLRLYSAWKAVNRPVEMHIYAQGGHGFALIPKGLPSDSWMERFWEWLRSERFVPS